MKVLFLGNHTVGVRTLATLRNVVEVVGVVAHPQDPEDGVRYESVFAYAKSHGLQVIRGAAKNSDVNAFVAGARADLLWVTDYRYLLPMSLVKLSAFGAVNLHPSLLPKYRGRASINWAILNGESTLGLTAHYIDEGMDTGDIIEQVSFNLRQDQDVGDALRLLYPRYEAVASRVLGYFRAGKVPRNAQDHSQATSFLRRKPDDGEIDWRQNAVNIVNLVRAVAAPYPGAFTKHEGSKLMIWRASVVNAEKNTSHQPGVVMARTSSGLVVACGDGCVLVERIEAADPEQPLSVREGLQFEVHS